MLLALLLLPLVMVLPPLLLLLLRWEARVVLVLGSRFARTGSASAGGNPGVDSLARAVRVDAPTLFAA